MRFIYNIGIYLLYLVIYIASFFNSKAKQWINGRINIFKKISEFNKEGKTTVWVHCSSLGEFEQGRPIIDKIKSQNPDWKIVISFFSPSGYEIRKNYNNADLVTYLPLDTAENAKKFISFIKPDLVYFIKYEHWYHYLKTLYKNNVPVYLVAANFRTEQLFFKSYGTWYRNILKFYSKIFVQQESSLKLLEQYNIKNVVISGDTRFDRVYKNSLNAVKFSKVQEFKNNRTLIIAGSSWEKEEELLTEFMNKTEKDLKYIIAPHIISESNINRIESMLKLPYIRYSKIDEIDLKSISVLIIDNIGMLSSLYQYGEIALIGGGFHGGLHNTLEAVTFGLPVFFGPKHSKFPEALELINQEVGFSIHNYHDFENHLNFLLDNPDVLVDISHKSKALVRNNAGACSKILNETILK